MEILQALAYLVIRVIFFGFIAFVAIKLGIAYRKKKDLKGNDK